MMLGLENPMLASSPVSADIVTTRRFPSKKSGFASPYHPHSWTLYFVFLNALFSTVAAVPLKTIFDYSHVPDSIRTRRLSGRDNDNNDNSDSSGSSGSTGGSIGSGIPMSIWLPVVAISIVFIIFSVVVLRRRFATYETRATSSTSATATRAANSNTTLPRRRPRRTPSQISTKSLPPYMKEPGDQELVLNRAPSEDTDDEGPPRNAMHTLAEDDEDREINNATFNISLNRVESYDSMDGLSTNLMRRPPALEADEITPLRHGTEPHSRENSAELLGSHQRMISGDTTDPRGDAPSYTEAVPGDSAMVTISLNDPEPRSSPPVARGVSSTRDIPASETGDNSRRSRSRFGFLHNPFHSRDSSVSSSHDGHSRAASPSTQPRNESSLSEVSSSESLADSRSRQLGNNYSSHSRSSSSLNVLRAFRSHSRLPESTSSISVNSISAPLTHTAIRAEFHAPKGGLMTAEQIKLITSREALERFGVPYGPDAVAYSLSRPPDFNSVAEGQPIASDNRGTDISSASSESVPNVANHVPVISVPLRSPSQASSSHLSAHRGMRSGSRASSYASAQELDEHLDEGSSRLYLQAVQTYPSDSDSETDDDEAPLTARPITPTTVRKFSLA